MVLGKRSRKRLAGSSLLASLCVAACPLSRASGTPLPAAQYTILFNNGTPITTPGTFSLGGLTGEIENTPAPLLFSHVTGPGTSFVQLLYFFRVDGPAPDLPVPIRIAGNVRISAGNAVFQQDKIWGVTAQVNAQAFDGPLGAGTKRDRPRVRLGRLQPDQRGSRPHAAADPELQRHGPGRAGPADAEHAERWGQPTSA